MIIVDAINILNSTRSGKARPPVGKVSRYLQGDRGGMGIPLHACMAFGDSHIGTGIVPGPRRVPRFAGEVQGA